MLAIDGAASATTTMASPADLIVDTSALMAILLPEPDGPSFYAHPTAARSPARDPKRD